MGKLSAARPVLVQMAAEAPGTAASSALETLIDATDSYDTSIKDHKATPKQAWNAFAQTVQREGIGTFLTNLAGVYSPEIKGVKGKIIHAGLDPGDGRVPGKRRSGYAAAPSHQRERTRRQHPPHAGSA